MLEKITHCSFCVMDFTTSCLITEEFRKRFGQQEVCPHKGMYCSLFRKYSYSTAINAGFLITIYLMLSGLRHFSRSPLSASQGASILQLIPLGAEVGSVRHGVPAITNICSKHIGHCNTCAGKYQASSSLTFVWRSD